MGRMASANSPAEGNMRWRDCGVRRCVCVFVCKDGGGCVHVGVRVPVPALGVVREVSLLLRVSAVNLWESCTLQLTLTRGSGGSGQDNVISG